MGASKEDFLRTVTVLPMTLDHVGAVHEIFRENFALPWSEVALRQECVRPDGITLVAVCEGDPIGFLSATWLLDEVSLNNIAVREGYKRHGVASALVRHFLDIVRGQGIARVYLEVRISNERAQRLYDQHGFVVVGRRKDCYAFPTEDALVMVCDLTTDDGVTEGERFD